MTDISDNLKRVNARIHDACVRYGRDPESVRLLAVSKTKPLAAVQTAFACGQRHFGENYLQDAVAKVNGLSEACWHFIGAIQSNKTRVIAEHFSWVHSVASAKVLKRLSAQRPADAPPLQVMFQVNIGGEDSKSGVAADALTDLVALAATCENLRPVGLMAIPRALDEIDGQRAQFAQLANLQRRVNDEIGSHLNELSMGMSNDLEAAVAEGATWVRIGTDIFGRRD